jgi:mannosyltransferase OCH1-like enzyme
MRQINKLFFSASLLFSANIFTLEIPRGFGVDFYEAMSCVKQNIPAYQASSDWQRAIELYNNFVSNPQFAQGPSRIPKIIHQIWLGSPIPDRYKKFQDTWRINHPDWEYILWTDKEVAEFGLKNQAQYDASVNWGQKADIARYEILNRYGGLYIDVDFECLRPFDIFHHTCDFYTGVTYGPNFALYNGLIGVAPNHQMMQLCIEKMNIHQKFHKDPIINILYSSGPYFFTRMYKNYMHTATDASVAFPVGYFYPWPNTFRYENEREQIEKWFKQETFAVHHWTVSWNGGIAPGQTKGGDNEFGEVY